MHFRNADIPQQEKTQYNAEAGRMLNSGWVCALLPIFLIPIPISSHVANMPQGVKREKTNEADGLDEIERILCSGWVSIP